MGCSPWGHKESSMTEQLTLNPLTLTQDLIEDPLMRGSQHFIQADWKPRALGRQKNFLSIYLKYIQSCRTISVSPTGHPSQEIWR